MLEVFAFLTKREDIETEAFTGEQRFLDRSRTKAYVIEERATAGARASSP